jgi:prolyl-tRNA synthetase
MKYSKMFGKTVREPQSDMSIASHKLLYQAGYIRESVAGRYFFLPLGMRVRDKIMAIIEEEMDSSGAQKMLSPILHPLELWQETNRDNQAGFELMKVKDRRGAEFALGGTGEEMFVDVVRGFNISYKDLPFNIYQFSQKFRDELRARGGLLRVREFTMKDAYSFHVDEEDFKKEYEVMSETYSKIFNRLGLNTTRVLADNGYIGGEYCHEYVVDNPIGESKYYITEDGGYIAHEDVATFKHVEVNPDDGIEEFKIIDQPEWVCTMDDNEKHYGKPAQYFLKNVVYVNFMGDIIIASIRGDLEVNKIKLEHVLDESIPLVEATDEDLEAIGTKSGFVHCWGHEFVKPRKTIDGSRDCKVIYVADNSLKTVKNFIGGQKEDSTDSFNVNYGRDFKHDIEGDIALAQGGFLSLDGNSRLIEKRGVEVGNIFQLGYHYSEKMKDALFVDCDSKSKPFYMGCYGIGLGRTLATIVEEYNTENGINWPISVSPYQIHLVTIGKDDEIINMAEELYSSLIESGLEILWDDREGVSPGVKFSDSDLIGIPIRVVLSPRSLKSGGLEVKVSGSDDSEIIRADNLQDRLIEIITELYDQI